MRKIFIVKRADTLLFKFGIILILPILIFGIWFSNVGYGMFFSNFVCSVKRAIGLPCPGCGMTRAFVSFFRLDFIRSFLYNPCIMLGFILYFIFLIQYTLGYYFTGKLREKEIRVEIYAYIFVGFLLIQWVLKLYIMLRH